jgi:hypothetical protein
LVGANGHDSVFGLLPLPLWPGTFRAPGAVPTKSWNRKPRPCCYVMHQSSKRQQ